MRLVIKLDLDNAAFEEGQTEEVERILHNLAERLPEPLDESKLAEAAKPLEQPAAVNPITTH